MEFVRALGTESCGVASRVAGPSALAEGRDGGEFQLTRAQEIQRQREGYLALEMLDATRFDFGIPDDFVRSVQAFRAF